MFEKWKDGAMGLFQNEEIPMKRYRWAVGFGAILLTLSLFGCGTVIKTYTKPQAPWGALQRFAVMPFGLPSENPVQRQLVTQLFAETLRNAGFIDLVEVPIESPMGPAVDIKTVGKTYQVDGVFSGFVDDTRGTVVHIRLQDAATEEVVWSGTYTLGPRSEFFSFKTQQQNLQRAFHRLVNRLVEARPSSV
jgi:TolB-like protein